jgi:hypothetical protein
MDRLHARPGARILDFATGSGRNGAALRSSGFAVLGIEDSAVRSLVPRRAAEETVAAALSSHGFLHGTRDEIARAVNTVATYLEAGGLLYATFGSIRDDRFGKGERLAPATFAPTDGDESGVAHTYFTEADLRALLAPHFAVEALEECRVDTIAGSWAHREKPLSRAVHWFVTARRKPAP